MKLEIIKYAYVRLIRIEKCAKDWKILELIEKTRGKSQITAKLAWNSRNDDQISISFDQNRNSAHKSLDVRAEQVNY